MQARLGSGVAVAVVWAGSCSSDSTSSLGTFICCKCGPKNTKKSPPFLSVVSGPSLSPITPHLCKDFQGRSWGSLFFEGHYSLMSSRGFSYMKVQVIYNVVLVPSRWQSNSAILYSRIYIIFQILFHCILFPHIECGSLCYVVGPCCLSMLYIVVCIC